MNHSNEQCGRCGGSLPKSFGLFVLDGVELCPKCWNEIHKARHPDAEYFVPLPGERTIPVNRPHASIKELVGIVAEWRKGCSVERPHASGSPLATANSEKCAECNAAAMRAVARLADSWAETGASMTPTGDAILAVAIAERDAARAELQAAQKSVGDLLKKLDEKTRELDEAKRAQAVAVDALAEVAKGDKAELAKAIESRDAARALNLGLRIDLDALKDARDAAAKGRERALAELEALTDVLHRVQRERDEAKKAAELAESQRLELGDELHAERKRHEATADRLGSVEDAYHQAKLDRDGFRERAERAEAEVERLGRERLVVANAVRLDDETIGKLGLKVKIRDGGEFERSTLAAIRALRDRAKELVDLIEGRSGPLLTLSTMRVYSKRLGDALKFGAKEEQKR